MLLSSTNTEKGNTTMDEFEKIEKLRTRANVTYEEAKTALNEANGDLLEAMIILEKEGKVVKPEQGVHSTEYTQEPGYEMVVAENAKDCGEKWGTKIKEFLKQVIDYLSNNHMKVSHHDEQVIDLPLWATVMVLVLGWWFILVLIVVSLFFDWNYKFYGKNNLQGANNVMDKAKETAEHVKEDLSKSSES